MFVLPVALVTAAFVLEFAQATPVTIKYGRPVCQKTVNKIIETLSIADMQADLAVLSNFQTRFYNSSTGAAASEWLLSYVTEITSTRDDINARAFVHDAFPQTSTIVRIEGSKNPGAPVTIVGSHIDSVNWKGEDPSTDRSPGADDDGSGSVNVLATLKALVQAGYKPSTPLEFHWYAGEEGGLLGSDAVAKQYQADGVEVKAYMQLDMNAYTKPGEVEAIAVRQDFSAPELNTFIEKLIETYVGLPVVHATCGYACSDHASWHRQGFPASMPFEGANRNPLFHTIDDTPEAPGFSWEHSKQFAKLAIAYAYELTA